MSLAASPPLPDAGPGFTAQPGVIHFHGTLNTQTAARLWPGVMAAAQAGRGRRLVLDVSAAAEVTTAGAALLAAALTRHGDAGLEGAPPLLRETVAQLASAPAHPRPAPPPWTYAGALRGIAGTLADATAFLGESLVAIALLRRRRRQTRFSDLVRVADEAGARAIPLVLLTGYLMGLILAFQSSIPLRRFGADLFVVNLVAVSLARELGPLLAAVILAGRTGSAFAAELGTMKVNEELAALETMGVSATAMLVLPRLAAAVLVMPALTLLLELAGLLGMLTVMMSFGFPPAAVYAQLLRALHGRDVFGGLFKALCFAAVVAGVGCRAGLATGLGPRAVGRAATAAVVGGIVATILLDGLFAVLFYRAGV